MYLRPDEDLTSEMLEAVWDSISLEGTISMSAIANDGSRPAAGDIVAAISAVLPGWAEFVSCPEKAD